MLWPCSGLRSASLNVIGILMTSVFRMRLAFSLLYCFITGMGEEGVAMSTPLRTSTAMLPPSSTLAFRYRLSHSKRNGRVINMPRSSQ